MLIATTRDALAAGAQGIVYGRNIWQADDPVERVAHILKVVEATTERPGRGRQPPAPCSSAWTPA